MQDFVKEQPLRKIQNTEVPALGFGTFQLKQEICRKAVLSALETGYRHIDTARMYENEEAVGQALKDYGAERESLFLTSKVWYDNLAPHDIRREVQDSLRLLQTEYLDLILIHWPNPDYPLSQSLEALFQLKEEGKVRQVGVSNFTPSLVEQAWKTGPIFCNQVECHPLLRQEKLRKLAAEKDFLLTAYSPLAQGKVHHESTLNAIGKKHGRSPEQVALAWLLTLPKVSPIPRSSKKKHIQNNFQSIGLQLDSEDLEAIESIPDHQRQVDPDIAPDWEY